MDVVKSVLKSRFGIYDAYCFDDGRTQPPIAFVMGEVKNKAPLLRIQSECLPGLVFSSLTCDCAGQRDDAMTMIASDGTGIIIHLWQEGRGIGLADKMRAYAKQINEGADTVEANLLIGRAIDERTYEDVKIILDYLHVSAVRLLTNNPARVEEMTALGIVIEEVIPIPPRVNPLNAKYIRVKAEKLRHTYDLDQIDARS